MLDLMLGSMAAWLSLVAAIVVGVLVASFLRMLGRELWTLCEDYWARLMWWLDL